MLRIIITVYGLYIGVVTCHRSRVSSGDTNEVVAVEQHNDTSDSEEVIRAEVLEIKGNANTGYGNQKANAEDPIFAKVLRGRCDIGPNQFFFRPCLVYQQINADHVCDKRLEFRVDFESGKNMGRFSSAQFGSEMDQDAFETESGRKDLLAKQLKFVDDDEGRADGPTIKSKLKTAACFADLKLMEYLIRTTYCTKTIGSELLAETVKEGNLDVVKLLLKCGADPSYVMHELDDRTALHFAASICREDICAELIKAMKRKEDAFKVEEKFPQEKFRVHKILYQNLIFCSKIVNFIPTSKQCRIN